MKCAALIYGNIISHFFPSPTFNSEKLFLRTRPLQKQILRTSESVYRGPDLYLPHSSFYRELSNGVVDE